MTKTEPRRYVSVNAAADYFGVAANTLRRGIERGDIPAIRIGTLNRVDLDELTKIFAEDAVNPASPRRGGFAG